MIKYFLLLLSLITLASCTTSPNTSEKTSPATNQQANTPLYVDVREPSEWAEGHVDGAILVPLGQIESGNFSGIPRNVSVSIYCRSGRRSAIAVTSLRNAGYTNITDAGGMTSLRGVNIVR